MYVSKHTTFDTYVTIRFFTFYYLCTKVNKTHKSHDF